MGFRASGFRCVAAFAAGAIVQANELEFRAAARISNNILFPAPGSLPPRTPFDSRLDFLIDFKLGRCHVAGLAGA